MTFSARPDACPCSAPAATLARRTVRSRAEPARPLVEPHFRRRISFQRPVPSARGQPVRVNGIRSTATAFPAAGWSIARRRTAPPALLLRRPRPVPVRSSPAIPERGRARRSGSPFAISPRPVAFRPRLSPMDRASARTQLKAEAGRVVLETVPTLPPGRRRPLARPNGTSPRRALFRRVGLTTPSSAGTARRTSYGRTGTSISKLTPIRRSRPTSSIRPPLTPTSSASSRSPSRRRP